MWKTSEVPFIKNNRPLVMAHRGDSANIPENTYQAFKDAYNLGVDVIETDVWMTKDKEFVFHHDKKVDRTTNGSGPISKYTLSELKKLDAGYNFQDENGQFIYRGKGFQIYTIDEILSEFTDIRFNMDIKDRNKDAPELLAKKLKDLDANERVQVGSFHQKQIDKFRKFSDSPTSAGPIETLKFHRKAKKLINKSAKGREPRITQQEVFGESLDYVSLTVPEGLGPIKVVTPESVQIAHSLNIAVFVWTINDEKEMERLLDWKVDGIFTDKPKVMVNLLNAAN